MGEDAIDLRLRAGRLHRLYAGVYAVGHQVLSQHARWLAAVRSRGHEAVLSHQSAGALWRIRNHYGGPIDVASPSKAKARGTIRAHRLMLEADEVTIHEGIPVTTVPRTILDLAADSPDAVEPALRQAEYLRLHDRLSLPDLLKRYPGHRGNKAIRTALARLKETPGRTRSHMEERFIRFVDHHRLPRPNLNVWLTVDPDRFQVDCLWPRQRLIAELDSWSAHGTRSAFRTDKTRDRKLLAAGYVTTRIAWSHLDDEPDVLAADLRTLLSSY